MGNLYYIGKFTVLCKIFTYLSRSFPVPCAPLSMLDGPSGTGCNGVRFPIHSGWNSRDLSVAGVCDCVKECVNFVM